MKTNETNSERVKNTSRKNQNIARAAAVHAYNNRRWTASDIWEAYDRPSAAKVRAWDYCRELCANMGGFDLLISGWNCMQFSVVFKFEDENTGVLCYAYITRDYDRFCEA